MDTNAFTSTLFQAMDVIVTDTYGELSRFEAARSTLTQVRYLSGDMIGHACPMLERRPLDPSVTLRDVSEDMARMYRTAALPVFHQAAAPKSVPCPAEFWMAFLVICAVIIALRTVLLATACSTQICGEQSLGVDEELVNTLYQLLDQQFPSQPPGRPGGRIEVLLTDQPGSLASGSSRLLPCTLLPLIVQVRRHSDFLYHNQGSTTWKQLYDHLGRSDT